MSDRYPGGLIRKTPPTITPPVDGEGGSAPGIWTLEQASYYQGTGEWPKGVLPRELYSWGIGTYGQLGLNSILNVSSPTQVGALGIWDNVSIAEQDTVATQTNGTLWTWGRNVAGQSGQNDLTARSSPVQVGSLTNWYKVSAGFKFVVAIKTNGTMWSWGENGQGQLGQNIDRNIDRSSPVQIGALTTWLEVRSGYAHSVALKTDGTLWSWGRNYEGQLGTSDITLRSSPVQVGGLTNWLSVTAGGYHTMAVKTDGTAWSWGRNDDGQLGIGTSGPGTNRNSPVQIGALTTWNTPGSGDKTSFIIKTDGTLWAWGENNNGQLGNNSLFNVNSPVQIGSLGAWEKVSGAKDHTVATQTDGTLWSWGTGGSGRTGHNNQIALSSPTQVGGLTTWNNIATMPYSGSTLATTKG